ncbi:MAG: argininosuccinate synthase [Oscillospiraceae bacterium]|nr:argininosuccinate synthase [Oscillospiraceae bacterium]
MSNSTDKPVQLPTVDRVVLGFNGGIDSVVAAQILTDQGFLVYGVYVRLGEDDETIAQATQKAAQLGISLHARDCSEKVNDIFTVLAQAANAADAYYIATGHYARMDVKGEHTVILPAAHKEYDQSASFKQVSQDIMDRLILPLGDFSKDDVLEVAQEYKLI